jgi:3-phenylpropionate/cinnamic acid dioxygenase small subunit
MTTDELTALRRLLDKDEIVELVHRYSYCVDHRLYDDVVELFTEDCIVDYGYENAPPVRSHDALRQLFGHPEGGFKATSHHNANVLITFADDDNAKVLTSVYAWHTRTDGVTPRLWGYYHDSVTRTSEGWRIAERELRVLGVEHWHANWHWALDKDVGS